MNAQNPPPPPPVVPAPGRPHRADQDFLPAALEVLEKPASPVASAMIMVIAGIVTFGLLWAWFGEIDIVAAAQGKIQPTGRVKLVQPVETGRVIAIHGENGMHVAEGDLIAELDPVELIADEASLRLALAAAEAEAVRRNATITELGAERPLDPQNIPVLTFADSVPATIRAREQRVLRGDLLQADASLASFAAQLEQKRAEYNRLDRTIAAQRNLVATLQERVDMRASLVTMNASSRAAVIDATETLQYQQAILAGEIGQLGEAEAAIGVINREMRKTRETAIAENIQKLADAEKQIDDLSNRLAKATSRRQHMTLRAPASGTIYGSSLTTVGQVVMPGEELMRIVPDSLGLEVEAYLQNKDVGFVAIGQAAVIKIESFPFTRYGTIAGSVSRVAHDAIPEPDAQQIEGNPAKSTKASGGFTAGAQRTQNLVFPITIRPERTRIDADGLSVPLSPGMAVTVEIKTGKRRVYEFIFSPLMEVTSTALKER